MNIENLSSGATKMCHFTSMENARNILSASTFYLSKFNAMNDLVEARLHEDENDKIFCLSFCHSEAMNIPLFYLYGGIDGKGCKLQFSIAKIKEMFSNQTLYYVNKSNKRLRKPIENADYSIDFDWIYYITSSGYYEYRNEKVGQFPTYDAVMQELKCKEKHYYVKNKIWKFEKEFRIIVKFSKPVKYDKIALEFDIKDNDKGISLVCGPENTEEDIENIKQEFQEYGISNIIPSSVNAISMKLCERNNVRR